MREPKITQRFFIEKHGINPVQFNSRWEWMEIYPHLISKFYAEIIFHVNNRVAKKTIDEYKKYLFKYKR